MKKDILQEIYTEFDANNKTEWQEQATKDLKGVPLASIDWQLNNEITQAAYYTEEDLPNQDHSVLKSYNPDWQIGQDYFVDDFAESNKEILADLNHGLNAPSFHFKNTPSVNDLETLFEGVGVQYIYTHFADNDENLLKVWKEYLTKQKLENVPVYFGTNNVNATQFYKDTANIHQEIKATINVAKQILEKSENKAITAAEMHFTFYVDNSYLTNVAKLRAFKLLWVDLMKSNGLEEKLPFIKTEFASSAYGQDEHDNLINATSMAMSAVLGGANHLIVLPSNETKQAKRLARNVQLILKHESGLHKVADPAQGSYYIENLTGKLVVFCKG